MVGLVLPTAARIPLGKGILVGDIGVDSKGIDFERGRAQNAGMLRTWILFPLAVAGLTVAGACTTAASTSTTGSGTTTAGTTSGATSTSGSTTGSSTTSTSGSTSGSGTTSGGSTTGSSTAAGSTSSSSTGGTSTGGRAGDGEVWIWVFTDFANSLDALAAHATSFTHVSPALYHMNYDYQSGVPSFVSTVSGCGPNTTTEDKFNGLTSTQIAQKTHDMGMKAIALVYGGAANCGTDQGIQNVLNDSPTGTQAAFISALVTEAQAKGYDGWNLDWETHLKSNPYAPHLTAFMTAAHTAFAAAGLSLSIDILASNVKQSYCSGGSGFVDLDAIGPVSDGVIIESYEGTIASQLTMCPTGLPDPLVCNYPNSTACPGGECVGSDLALMCAHLSPDKVVIGLDAVPHNTNPIAGAVVTIVENYGFKRIAIWPDSNSDAPGGHYAFLDTKGIVPATTDWYQLMQGFLTFWGQ